MDEENAVQPKTLAAVWGALLILTGATILLARARLGFLSIAAALAIATGKASLVALFFMDLRHEGRVVTRMLLTALLILAVFIGLTFFDVGYRS
jgi:cytochrome c oxidase subunit IV